MRLRGGVGLPAVLVVEVLLGLGCWVGVVEGWSDDIFFFTSFQNVSEWGELYERCVKQQAPARHHLTPVALPRWDKLFAPPPSLAKRTLQIYNKPPPRSHGSYSVSYTFPKRNECLYHKAYAPCYIDKQTGYIRAVVLRTEWESSKDLRDTSTIEGEEEYGSLLTGEDHANEKFFTAALFLGSAVDKPDSFRSTHTIDGKGYPMEIYMFFVDEELTAAQKYVTLVVLVEESEDNEDNLYVEPLVKAVNNHLKRDERQFLRDKQRIFQRERMFHHSQIRGCKNYPKSCSKDEDWGGTPAQEWKTHVDESEKWQQYLAYESNIKFRVEEKEKLERLIRGLVAEILNVDRVHNPEMASFWILPSVARAIKYDPRKSTQAAVNQSKTALRMTEEFLNVEMVRRGNITAEQAKLVPEKEKSVMDPAVKAYVDWVKSQDYGCTIEGNSRKGGRIQDVQWWKRLKSSIPRTRQEIQKNLKKGKDDLHPFVKIIWALGEVMDGINKTNGIIKCILNCDDEKEILYDQLFKYYNLDVTIAGTILGEIKYLENAVRKMKRLQIYEKKIEKIKSEFFIYAHDAGLKSVDEFLKEIDAVRKERMAHYDKLEHDDRKNEKDRYDAYIYKRTDPIELGNLGMSEFDKNEYFDLDSAEVPLTSSFQFSWLIPKGGGYYIYKGTLPVPPCYRTEMTYVFKVPIHMSKRQIEALTTVPTSWSQDVSKDIKSTFAPLHEAYYYVPTFTKTNKSIPYEMYFEPRNHLTLGEDGVHANSLKAAKKRRDDEDEKIRKNPRFGKYAPDGGRGTNCHFILLLLLPIVPIIF